MRTKAKWDSRRTWLGAVIFQFEQTGYKSPDPGLISADTTLITRSEYSREDARNARSPVVDKESIEEDERRNTPTGKLEK